MKKVLLDTNVFLWFLAGDKRLTDRCRQLIEDQRNDLCISIVSFWEMTIKMSLGKLDIAGGLTRVKDAADDLGLLVLPISFESLKTLEELPFMHRDPFDRIIIATALAEGCCVVTSDENFSKYDVATLS